MTRAPRSWPDHPRVSGEHIRNEVGDGNDIGSSPRERGAPSAATHETSAQRIIPA